MFRVVLLLLLSSLLLTSCGKKGRKRKKGHPSSRKKNLKKKGGSNSHTKGKKNNAPSKKSPPQRKFSPGTKEATEQNLIKVNTLLDKVDFHRFSEEHRDRKKMKQNLVKINKIFHESPEILQFQDKDGNNYFHLIVKRCMRENSWGGYEGMRTTLQMFVNLYKGMHHQKNNEGKTALDIVKDDPAQYVFQTWLENAIQNTD